MHLSRKQRVVGLNMSNGNGARITCTNGGDILEWNDGATELYGWTAEEALGRDIFELIPTGLPEPFEEILATLESGKTWSGLFIQRAKDGGDLAVDSYLALEDGLVVQTCTIARSDAEALSTGPLAASLLDTFPGSVFLFDIKEPRSVFIRGMQFANLGYSHEEVHELGPNLMRTILHPEDWARLPDQLAQYSSMSKGDLVETDRKVQAKDGTWRHLHTCASLFAWDEDGNPSHVVGFASDVTETREAEQTFRRAQEQLKFALSSTGMIAWIWDYSSGEVLRMGDISSIFGSIENTADAFFKAIHPDDWHLSEEAIEQARNGNPMEGVQMRIVRDDGQVRWIEERGLVQYDAQGNPTHMVGVTIDITDQKRKDEISRRTHRSLRLALQAARASTWQWDCLTNLIVVSDDAFELFGLPRGAPPTMDEWLERIHPEDRNQFQIEARKTAIEGMDLCIDFRLVMPDGTTKPTRAVAQRATDDNGNATEVIGIVMDLSIFRGLLRLEDESEGEQWAA
jgi:PAS domain S-box-containing protein